MSVQPLIAPADTTTSRAGDFRVEFEAAMGGDFDFKGSFACGDTFPQAPNPVLCIEGLGLIGLPLSDRDAQSIISCSARAPFGHNEQTVVNSEVRDTWEIEPAKISFQNPAWNQFVQDQVLKKVTAELASGSSQTHCELYKLLLYQEGSHFHRHQDTAKSPGMFATVIIILPSVYSGGQVHVSHASSSKVFDFSAQSLLSTVALAWYTDVVHEVKPVTSGFRLALSYNLIRDPMALSVPRLPDMNASAQELCYVLQKWKEGRYASGIEHDLLAYILEHHYSTSELDMGIGSLKGSDAHKLAHIREIADELGFEVYLANLDYHESGAADDDGGGYHKRGRWGGYDEYDESSDEGTPGMMEVYESDLTADHVVDLDGESTGCSTLTLEMGQLVPSEPFDDADPDDTEYEGYMGNGAGGLDQYYHRTVMIIVHADNAMSAFAAADPDGSYGFHRLQQSATALTTEPTHDDKKLANIVIDHLRRDDKDIATTLLTYALCWKDLTMWKRLVVWLKYALSANMVSEGWKVYGFEPIRDILEQVVAQAVTFTSKMNLLDIFKGMTSPEEAPLVTAWSATQKENAILNLKLPTSADTDTIIKLIQESGASWFDTKIFPNIAQTEAVFPFWVSFTRALYTAKHALPESVEQNDALVDKCMQAAMRLWEIKVAAPYNIGYSYSTPTSNSSQAERIINLVDLCIDTNRTISVRALFCDILKQKPPSTSSFTALYQGLVAQLRQRLNTKNIAVYDAPFGDIMQVFVGSYLNIVLGGKPKPVNMRQVTCGCSDCRIVNAFLHSPTLETQQMSLLKKPRDHVIAQLRTVSDLLDFDIIQRGRPQPLRLKRTAGVTAVRNWTRKQAEARGFLQSVGNDADLGRLMGARYADVLRSLEGKKFALPVQPGPPASGPSTGVVPASVSGPTNTTQGQKRKHPIVMGDVIDLTAD